jgi:RND family efflux transporter MFP subunit
VAVLVLPGLTNNESQAAGVNETAEAFIGDLSASATASGQVFPRREATLSANRIGRIESVFVRVGDRVQEDDILVQLDTADLALTVAAAEQNLLLKEANLADLLEGASETEIASADAGVASARAELDDLLAGPSAEELAAQEANLLAAQANVWSSSAQLSQVQNAIKPADIAAAEAALVAAQANLTGVEIQYTRNPSPDDIQANTALAQAREQLASAQARLDSLLAGPDQNQVGSAQAGLSAVSAQRDASEAQFNKLTSEPNSSQVAAREAQLAQAEATLANLLQGATEEQIISAKAEVEQARVNLADATAALDAATIIAPFTGVISAVNFSPGEFASDPIVTLIDENSLEVILQVDEVDVGSLVVGQPATLSLEAWPDVTLNSEILTIAPKGTTAPGSSLVVYEVHLSLGDTGLPVLSGLTTNANLITAEKEDVLLVPNQAINVDRSNGTYSVVLVIGDTTEEVAVTIGLRDSRYTQITSGLNPGDLVLTSNNLPVLRLNDGRPGGGSRFGGND